MRIYKGKEGDIIPHLSLQEETELRIASSRFVPIYRANDAIGRYDRNSSKFIWNKGTQFPEDSETFSLFKPDQE